MNKFIVANGNLISNKTKNERIRRWALCLCAFGCTISLRSVFSCVCVRLVRSVCFICSPHVFCNRPTHVKRRNVYVLSLHLASFFRLRCCCCCCCGKWTHSHILGALQYLAHGMRYTDEGLTANRRGRTVLSAFHSNEPMATMTTAE